MPEYRYAAAAKALREPCGWFLRALYSNPRAFPGWDASLGGTVFGGRIEIHTSPRRGRATRCGVPAKWPLLVALAAVAAFSAAPPANAAERLERPSLADMAVSSGTARYAQVRALDARVAAGPSVWGGRYTTNTGEAVTIYASRSYPEDPATAQRWANFLASLIHGSELSSLTTYLFTPDEVTSVCGRDALACYSDQDSTLVAPGEDLSEISAEALITHEYGHHVAAHRRNDPWAAVDWGTKRWATYEQVCARTRTMQLFPGAEDATNYDRNPGEGFAESYRVLNERRAGIPEAPWQIVNEILYPDQTALSLLEQDVRTPWNGNTTSSLAGSFSAKAPTKTFTVAAPEDGSLRVSVRAPKKGRLSVSLFTSAGARVATAAARPSATATVSATVCGTRAYRLRVARAAGSGSYRATVSKP